MQSKPCKFIGCSLMPKIGCGGYCFTHRVEDAGFLRKKEATERKLAAKKIVSKLRTTYNRGAKNEGQDSELEKWFADIAQKLKIKNTCWECKKTIPEKYFRAATAHILPKAIFTSVATHPLNFVICCAGNGCHRKTEILTEIPKMKIYPIIRERFLAMLPMVKEKHKYLNNFIDLVNEVQ